MGTYRYHSRRNDEPLRSRLVQLHVFVQLIIPTPTKPFEWSGQPPVIEMPPDGIRVVAMDLRCLPGICLALLVCVNSYSFYVFKEEEGTPISAQRRKQILATIFADIPGAQDMAGRSSIAIHASPVDFAASVSASAPFRRHVRLMGDHKDKLEREQSG